MDDTDYYIEHIAMVAHNVNRAYCIALSDFSQQPWEHSEPWQRASAIDGVKAHLKSDMTPEQSHDAWKFHKLSEGWKYGPVKDMHKKEHPCIVAYTELPLEQRVKDYLFKAVVDSLNIT